MIYGWIISGLTALGLGVKSVVESQEGKTFSGELPSVKGLTKLHKNHNNSFPSGFMKERPELVKGVPLTVISATAGALATTMQDKGKTGEKLNLSLVMGGTLSNLHDHVMCGYVMDYFIIEQKFLKKVALSLGDIFVLLRSAIFALAQIVKSLEEAGVKKEKK